MSLSAKLRRAPGRLAAGAFILNSGLTKRRADEQTAAMLHGTATTTYPFLGKLAPEEFTRLLSTGEIAVGTALLLPVVPAFVAGAALTGFAGALLGLYLRVPGLRENGSLKPTQRGTAMAKDVWMLGIGLGLVADALTSRD